MSPVEILKRPDGITFCICNDRGRADLISRVHAAMAASQGLASCGIESDVLIVDDLSRAASPYLASSLAMTDAAGRLQAAAGNDNGSASAMRTRGLAKARHRWVCFVDVSELLFPQSLAELHQSARNTGAALVYGNTITYGYESDGKSEPVFVNDIGAEALMDISFAAVTSLMDSEQAFAIGGSPSGIGAAGDWTFLQNLIDAGRLIVFVPIMLGLSLNPDRGEIDVVRLYRIFNQRRESLPTGFRPRVYHPSIGYLI
jgi:hypothetical protein